MTSKAIIVSAGWRAWSFIPEHIRSVNEQTYKNRWHGIVLDECSHEEFEVEVEKLEETPEFGWMLPWTIKGCTLNSQHEAISLTDPDPDDVLIWLDADDKFHDSEVLDYVMDLYNSDPELLLAYGQLVPEPYDPRCPRANPYPQACHRVRGYRNASRWGHQFNHLRTMRFKLWDAVPDEYTIWPDGNYFQVAGDAAEMVSGMEMAGSDRIKFMNRPNVLYNTANQLSDWRRDPREINRTHAYIESLPKLEMMGL